MSCKYRLVLGSCKIVAKQQYVEIGVETTRFST